VQAIAKARENAIPLFCNRKSPKYPKLICAIVNPPESTPAGTESHEIPSNQAKKCELKALLSKKNKVHGSIRIRSWSDSICIYHTWILK
jgi:hypothetical protein